MKEGKTYKQCRLEHPATRRFDTAWIPSKYAFVGKHVQIRKDGLKFEDGWVVTEVYAGVWDQEDAQQAYEDHKRFDYVLGN